MVARHRKVIGINCADPSFSSVLPLPASNFVIAPPKNSDREIVFILAGSLAGFTT
jgi:hypothetical protein